MKDEPITLSNTDEWQVTTERFVGYIDIMGFKDLVSRASHVEIYEMMKKIERSNRLSENAKWVESQMNLITTTTYSDSIILYSKDGSDASILSIVCAIASITNDLLIEKIPYKGAIAFGTMTLDTKLSIFFGQPLIDSYLLSEELSFYGFVVHASAEKKIDENGNTMNLPFLQSYMCPFKNGNARHLTIFPMHTQLIGEEYKAKHQKILDAIQNFRYTTSGSLRKYIDSTESYLNMVREQKKPI